MNSNKNSRKKEKIQENYDSYRYRRGPNFFLLLITFIMAGLYILAIISNFKFIKKCNVNGKWMHYLMAIFGAPYYWSKTYLWPSLCGLAEKASESIKENTK
tara:strand:- start:36 stop:338 length:303 start_codon:yes stop_codon:yes gene_type:complete